MDVITVLHIVGESLIVYLAMLATTKLVFLEDGISGRAGIIFHIIGILISITTRFYLSNSFWGSAVTAFIIGINIFVGRQEKKFASFFLAIPIAGLVDGLMVPTTVMPTVFFGNSDLTATFYQTSIYYLLIAAIITFYVFHKEAVKTIISDSNERTLKIWERTLLIFIGNFLVIYTVLLLMVKPADIDMNTAYYNIFMLFFSVLSLLLTISVIAVVLVGNRQHHYFNKVSAMQFSIITMMAEIVENRDKNTGGHIKRTAKYVEIIGRQLKRSEKFTDILTDEYIENICVAAPLHDIGKIHVSDTILNKEGPLTDEEFAEMKTHAAEGRKLLTQAKERLGEFEYLDIAIEMAGYHHEWWDGSEKGYPDHCKGEEIPLCARIMAVADVFDALTTKRCYKDAMPLSKAYWIIRKERGTHFDPDVVDAFFTAQTYIEEAFKEFSSHPDIE